MTQTEKAIREFCGHHADWWPSTTQVQEILALAQPCLTCEALARTVMLDQTSHDIQRQPFTESMIKAGLAELEAIRQTEFVGDYELIKRLLEAAHNIKENT